MKQENEVITYYDVVGIGNAIVDVLAKVGDRFLTERNLPKDCMTLLNAQDAGKIYTDIVPERQVPGGSAANTVAGIASLGGAPAFIVVAVHKNSPCKNEDPIIALTWFELLANAMGLGCCWCGFAQRAFTKFSSLRKMLELDKNYQVGSVILFGYPEVKYQREILPEKFETKIL